MTRAPLLAVGGLLLATVVSGCGDTHDSTAASESSSTSSDHVESPELDSMVVLGHSGTTGFDSDPSQPGLDVRENSWATGTNPKVNSVYQRLLASHPALEGHTVSLGLDGSTVDDLDAQVDAMLELDPLPDLVIIQSIDNDLQCDGTDGENRTAFARTLDGVLDRIDRELPDAQVFLVDVWASAKTYVDIVKDLPGSVIQAEGTGPCDTFTYDGKVRPAGVATLQRLVDAYFHVVQRVCAEHDDCYTDGGAMKGMPLRLADLTSDSNHLSVQGHAVMARYAWAALPAAIKNRD
jgi:lysophospholipase L1-like esterase